MDPGTFLESFFGSENRITLPSHGKDSRVDEQFDWLEPWIEALHDDQRPVVLLPRLTHEGETVWYALAFSLRQLRTLREDLLAFLGPTLTDFDGSPPPPPEDDLELAVSEYTAGNYFRLRVPRGTTAEEGNTRRRRVRDAISTMSSLHRRRPNREPPVVRQVGRILRDFEWALRASDSDSSLAHLNELRASGRVSALNLAYLRIQRFSALGKPRELLADRDLPEVLQSRRPALVTDAVLTALYDTYVRAFAINSDARAALRVFEDEIATPYGALFRGRGSLASDSVRTMFMLWASADPKKEVLRREILDLDGPCPPLVAELAGLSSGSESSDKDPLHAAEVALNEGAFESAFGILSGMAAGSQELTLLALRCAFELETKDSSVFAIEQYEALDDVARVALGESRTAGIWLDSAKQFVSLPGSWCEFVGALNIGAADHEDETPSAKNLDSSWGREEFTNRGYELQGLILADRDAAGQSAFRDALPYMVSALDRISDGASNPAVRAVYESLILHLATRQGLGAAELDGLLDLIRVIFDAGVDHGEYSDLVETLAAIWTQHESRRWFGWLLEAGELVSAYPRLNSGTASAFAGSLLASCQRFQRHLGGAERQVARDLLLQFDLSEDSVAFLLPESRPEAIQSAVDYSSMYVAVYTLARGVGERVKRLLEDAHPGIEVRISSDHVGSLSLRDMARNADVFVVATRAAKHAATEFIKAQRPPALPVVYPRGKGSSSIIEGLYEWAEGVEFAA